MSRYIDADKLKKDMCIPVTISYYETVSLVNETIDDQPTANVVEVGKWCDMHEYILEMQADENGHNEFFRIIKLPVIDMRGEA